MTGERTVPGLGLTSYYDDGSVWDIDDDIRLTSVVTRGFATSMTTDVASFVDDAGNIYIVPDDDATNPSEVAIWDGASGSESWVYLTPQVGWKFWVEDADALAIWDGTAWAAYGTSALPAYGGGEALYVLRVNSAGGAVEWVYDSARQTVETVSATTYGLVQGDLLGGKYKRVDNASGCAVTVTAGLTVDQPVTFFQVSGAITFVADTGVTINSKDSNLVSNGAGVAVTLLPVGANEYDLVGDLTT